MCIERIEINEARVRANLLLRVRDELDAADKLPAYSRRQRRQKILEAARREYGSEWDDDGIDDCLDAADNEWHDSLAELASVKQLAMQRSQGMCGAA